MGRRRDRDRKPARRQPFRNPLPIILIVCEGVNTEPQYIDGFSKAYHNPRVMIEIANLHGVPMTLVRRASDLKRQSETAANRAADDNLAYDRVWCVFDVDEHPQISEAIEMARANGIELAISNPCFELWLVLHFRDNPGPQHRADMRTILRQFVTEYDKRIDFQLYAPGYNLAVLRAGRMDRLASEINDVGGNPTTGVYRLTELIRTHGQDPDTTDESGDEDEPELEQT